MLGKQNFWMCGVDPEGPAPSHLVREDYAEGP